MRGRFLIDDGICGAQVTVLPNTIVDQGAQAFLKMATQGDNSVVASGGTSYYMGLCSGGVSLGATLASLVGELSTGTGYSRQQIGRDLSGWPSAPVGFNGAWLIKSKTVSFSASANQISAAFTRAFLCNASTGTAGTLLAISAPLQNPATLVSGAAAYQASYELLL